MSQYTINIGAIPNDGTGDPLRTAFNETNLNFNQIFAAGPVLSNIQIANNAILTTNTNGNLVLAPNGTGVVQSNVSIVPNTANIRNLGSSTQRWATVYTQYLNATQINLAGDLAVSGNLTVQGNIIQIGNIVTDSLTIQLANTATTANAADGAGITVGANDNIATFLYSSFFNSWSSTIGIQTSGNILGNLVAAGGNGQIQYNRNGIISASPTDFNYDQSTETLYVTVGSFAGDDRGTSGLFVGFPAFTNLGTDVIGQFTGSANAYSQINLQNANAGPQSSGDYIITANDGNDVTHFVDLGITGNNWDGSQDNSLGNALVPGDGYLYVQDGNLAIAVKDGSQQVWYFDMTGNLTLPGNTFSVNYANGAPVSVGSSYGNSNVATFMADFGSNTISTTGNIYANTIFGRVAGGGNGQIQFNVNGNLSGASYALNYDDSSNTMYVITGSFSGDANGSNGLFVGYPAFTELGSDVMGQFTGNVPNYTQINLQNISNSAVASGDYIITADNGDDTTHFLDLGMTSSTWDGTQPNSLGNRLGPNDGYLYVQDGNFVVGISNGQVVTWKFDETGNLTTPGNIVPDTNNTYSLGNATNQWSDLYVSNATIYMNNVPVSLTSGNVLTVDGNDVVTTNTDGQTNIGNLGIGGTTIYIADGAEETVINISPSIESQAFIQVPKNSVANVANVRIHNDAGNIEFGTSNSLMFFDNTGNLSVPSNINFNGGEIVQVPNNNLIIRVQDADNNGYSLDLVVDDGAEAQQTRVLLNRGAVEISLDMQGVGYDWSFNDNGEFDLAGNISGVYGNNNSFYAYDDGVNGSVELKTISYLNDTLGSNVRVTQNNATISTGNAAFTWTFDNTGNLTAPGNISTTGNVLANNMSLTGNIVGNIGFTGTDITINNSPGGQEGGELKWALPAPANTVLTTSITQDVFQNGMRVFETGGTNRGLYMDLGNVPNGSNTAVGYRDIPQVSFTGDTTIATTDAGRHYYSTLSTGNVLTIANNASQGFQIGAAITIVNQGSGAITVAQGSGVTLYLAGNVTAGNRTVATFGMATIMKVATDTWFINGTGVS